MTYDFDTVISRRGTDSMKWDVGENELAMWVADMDFPTAPEVREALQKRLDHGIFGYSDVPEAWYAAYMDWWKNRHGLAMEKDWLIFCTGVIPAISSIINKLTTPNENVLIMTPVYNIFFNSIINHGCRVLESELVYENGAYAVDFEDLEQKLADPQTSMMILCNPHNPVGKIWDRDILARIGHLARKHSVIVISDEIHCDLTLPGRDYIPFASVNEECRDISITCVAPTKAFNIAGLQTSAVIVPNPVLRHKVWRGLNNDEVAEPNVFACVAAVAAFTQGGAWLDALREYLAENRRISAAFIAEKLPMLHLIEAEATYLLWIDVSALGENSTKAAALLREKTGLYVSAGGSYGKCGASFLRVNIACPRALLLDGLSRLEVGIYDILG